MLKTASRLLSRTAPNFANGGARRGLLRSSLAPDNRYPKWSAEWIEREAEHIAAKAYAHHHALGDTSNVYPTPPCEEELKKLAEVKSFPPKKWSDRIAKVMVDALVPVTHWLFGDRYNHHAVVLETVAAVPGMVAGMTRHLRSLRRMDRDHGWIHPLLEEAENERMHLLIWMQVTKPTALERVLVMGAQGLYFGAYFVMYLTSPGMAHRFVGYLEERAVIAYTEYLEAVDNGRIENVPAPLLARKYYRLPDDAKLRDVILFVRADECMHRNVNHHLSDLYQQGRGDAEPDIPLNVNFAQYTEEKQAQAQRAD